MRLYKVATEEALGTLTASYMIGMMMQPHRVNMAITGGTSPKEVYKALIPQVKGQAGFSNVHFYNFDEVPYASEDQEGVTISELRRVFLEPAGIAAENVHRLDQHNYLEQDDRIRRDGGLDLMLIGVGSDGHYCGYMPGTTTFNSWTSRVELNQAAREQVVAEFSSGDLADVPDYFVTMGPRSVMAAKNILMIATGTRKQEIVKTLMAGKLDANVPATLLTLHPSFVLIADEAACSLL